MTGDNWQSKTLVVAISDPLSSIVLQEFSIFDFRISSMETIFFQQEHEKCKLFLVAHVTDCFGYVFSGPIFNKHFT